MPLLALQIKEILVEESNVQPVNSPVTVSWLAPLQAPPLAGLQNSRGWLACCTTWCSWRCLLSCVCCRSLTVRVTQLWPAALAPSVPEHLT